MCHITDGVIFTPVEMPYSPGTNDRLFKWKYPHMNSVDFQISLLGWGDSADTPAPLPFDGPPTAIVNLKKPLLWGEDPQDRKLRREDEVSERRQTTHRCLLQYQTSGAVVPYREVRLPERLRSLLFSERHRFHGKVVECAFDRQAGEWTLLRVRWDKDVPNYCLTIADALESAAQNLTREDLIREMERDSRGGRAGGGPPASASSTPGSLSTAMPSSSRHPPLGISIPQHNPLLDLGGQGPRKRELMDEGGGDPPLKKHHTM